MQSRNRVVSGCGFHHVAVRVHDFDAATRFYKALGMTETLAWGKDDHRAAMLDTGDGNYMEIFAGGLPGEKSPSGEGAALIHVALRAKDVDATTQAAQAAGAVVTHPPKDVTIDGVDGRKVNVRIAFVQAPGGEVVEFFNSREL